MTPIRRLAVLFMAIGALGLLASACVSGSKIRADAEVVKRDIAKARESGAYKCAPKDLAIAETNVRFCLDELDQGEGLELGAGLRRVEPGQLEELGHESRQALAMERGDLEVASSLLGGEVFVLDQQRFEIALEGRQRRSQVMADCGQKRPASLLDLLPVLLSGSQRIDHAVHCRGDRAYLIRAFEIGMEIEAPFPNAPGGPGQTSQVGRQRT